MTDNQSTARDGVEVTQADRDAAFNIYGVHQPDHEMLVQAFARHRLNTLTLTTTPAQPDGWVLVPNDPTDEMIEAGAVFAHGFAAAASTWSNMLAAAPTPAVEEPTR